MDLLRPPRPSPLTACATLAILAAITFILPSSPLTGVLAAILTALLASELDRSGRHIALRITAVASRCLPPDLRDQFLTEWEDHVLTAGEAGARPVLAALSIALWGAPRMALRYRTRVRVARYIWGLFLAQRQALESMLPLPDKQRKFARNMAAHRALMAVIGTGYLYLLLGRRRADRCPRWLLVGIGGMFTLACLPGPLFALAALVTGAKVFDSLPAWGIFAALIPWGIAISAANKALDPDHGERVVRRIGGPALKSSDVLSTKRRDG